MSPNSNIVQAVADLVRDRYVFPQVAERLSTYLTERLSSGAYAKVDSEQLAAHLTEDLQRESGDLHLIPFLIQ